MHKRHGEKRHYSEADVSSLKSSLAFILALVAFLVALSFSSEEASAKQQPQVDDRPNDHDPASKLANTDPAAPSPEKPGPDDIPNEPTTLGEKPGPDDVPNKPTAPGDKPGPDDVPNETITPGEKPGPDDVPNETIVPDERPGSDDVPNEPTTPGEKSGSVPGLPDSPAAPDERFGSVAEPAEQAEPAKPMAETVEPAAPAGEAADELLSEVPAAPAAVEEGGDDSVPLEPVAALAPRPALMVEAAQDGLTQDGPAPPLAEPVPELASPVAEPLAENVRINNVKVLLEPSDTAPASFRPAAILSSAPLLVAESSVLEATGGGGPGAPTLSSDVTASLDVLGDLLSYAFGGIMETLGSLFDKGSLTGTYLLAASSGSSIVDSVTDQMPLPLTPSGGGLGSLFFGAAGSGSFGSSSVGSGSFGGVGLAILTLLLVLPPTSGRLSRSCYEFLRPKSALCLAFERPG